MITHSFRGIEASEAILAVVWRPVWHMRAIS